MQQVVNYKRFLPHKQGSDSVLFVTWRQNLTIPQAILDLLQAHKQTWDQTHLPDENKDSYFKQRFQLFDTELAKFNHPEFSLTQPEIAVIIKDAFMFYADKKYCLCAFCIMSNHVHIQFQALLDKNGIAYRLPDIVQGLKSYTAKRINEIRATSGSVWARGYYDRIIRDESDYWNVQSYILKNPVKAGIVKNWEDYPYSYRNPALLKG
jgi:putative transposase